MESGHVVLDISSDEDNWGGEIGRCGGGGGVFFGDNYDWISELFDEEEREPVDSDDVVLVGEVVLKPKRRSKKSSSSSSVSSAKLSSVRDLDDDCVVLDGDPDKPVVIENNNSGADSDDLLIVGEKGQIACRDYPHPRHLCAKFAFTSNSHERHCHLCHCYVCDSLAPCVYWGNGTSIVDHCHATEKDEFWKLQRRNFKQGDKAPPAVPKLVDTSLPTRLPTSLAQNQISRPTTIRACSTSTNFGFPNITNQGRSQQSVHVSSRNKFHPHLVSQQLRSTHNNIVRRERKHNVDILQPQFTKSHPIFKRPGSAGGALATNRSGYSSSNNSYVSQYSRNPLPVAPPNDKNPTRWDGFSTGVTSYSNAYQTPSEHNTCNSFGNSVPSQPQVSSHPNTGSVFVNSVPSQIQVPSPPNIDSSFVNLEPSPQASSQSNMDNIFENPLPAQTQMTSQPSLGSSYVCQVPSQSQQYYHTIPSANDSQYGLQRGNEAQSALDSSFSDFNTSWVAPIDQSNQQYSADNSHVQSAEQTYHPPLVSEFDPQIPVNTIPGSLDYEYNNWMLDANLYSPEHTPVDAGFVFDF